jgi:hypothetical protein
LENPADGTPPLTATPRHLRRRRLHEDIPDTLLVPGAEPLPLPTGRESHEQSTPEKTTPEPTGRERPAPAKRAAELDPDDEEVAYRRKRLAALIAVVFVVVSVPLLVLALLLLG